VSMRPSFFVALLFSLTGCYHYRAAFPDHGAPATLPQTVTTWSFLWGLVQQDVQPDNCAANAVEEVTVSTNFAFDVLTIVTLGTVSPATVTWRCAKPCPGGL
jgi:Bor protein